MSLEKNEMENVKEKILQNDDYMKWLEKFTNRYPSFYENDLSGRGCNDIQNRRNLDLLFEVVDEYAEANYFYPKTTRQGIHFHIKYNGVGYKIGFASKNAKFYCERTEPMEDAIDFHYIQKNTTHPHAYFVESELYHIADSIKKLMVLGLEPENIEKLLEKRVDKCKKEKQNKQKVKTPKNN